MSDTTVGALGERALIERISSRGRLQPAQREGRLKPAPTSAYPAFPHVVLGIGDDAAAIEPERGALDILTTDSLVEGVHFTRAWSSARTIGHKALAVNLSDLAAMGAMPRAALLSLALPSALPLAWFDELIDGIAAHAMAARVPLVGGNITRSPGPIVIDMTLVGAARPRKMLKRTGARAGDELYVTGTLGAAAAGLLMLEAGIGDTRDALASDARECITRFEQPEPRLRCGLLVARTRTANACMDVSDGLADAARQLAEANGAGVTLIAADVPVHAGARAWCAANGGDALSLAMSGGEDYELLFAVGPRRRRGFFGAIDRCRGLIVTMVGKLTKEPGHRIQIDGRTDELPHGYGHF